MPKPRPLGNVAKYVLTAVEEALAANQDLFVDVVMHIRAGDDDAAMLALKQLMKRENAALRAITHMLGNQMNAAEEIVMTTLLSHEARK